MTRQSAFALLPFALLMAGAANAVAQTNFPPPVAPANNPPNANKVLLGMALFFEEQLSSTGTVACATCHDFRNGGADPRTGSGVHPGYDGVFGTDDDRHGSPGIPRVLASGAVVPTAAHGLDPAVTPRRAPTVVNSGYHTRLGYEGASTTLEQLIAVPLQNPVEMSHENRTWAEISQQLAAAVPLTFASDLPTRLANFVAGRDYPELFALAFGSSQIDQQSIVQAIACYLRTLNSDRAKWDLVQAGLDQLTPEEQLGLTLFTSPANGATSCNTCHGDFEARVQLQGPIVGQITTTNVGPYGSLFPTRLLFHNVGVRPVVEDLGRQNATNLASDAGKFRVASLRNVELTGPYFHTGTLATLHDVVDLYDRGGDFHVNQAANLTPRNYTAAEKDALVALLRTLTDPRVAAATFPFDQPTLGAHNLRQVLQAWESESTQSGALVARAPFAPRLGESRFQVNLSGVTPGVPTFLMWDTGLGPERLIWNVILSGTPAFQAFYTGIAQPLPGSGSGYVQVPVPLPAVPSLSGTLLFAQWAVLEPSAQWPIASSNALYIPLR